MGRLFAEMYRQEAQVKFEEWKKRPWHRKVRDRLHQKWINLKRGVWK